MTDKKQSVQAQMAALEASGEDMVPISEVRKLMESVKGMFQGDFAKDDVELYGELGDLAKYINEAKKELRQFEGKELTDSHLPEASDQLDAIIRMTEKATGSIMDSCERIQSVHQRLRDRLASLEVPLDPDVMASVEDALGEADANIMGVFESCNFQDITGQRIMKIVNVLQEIERQILRMVIVFGLRKNEDSMDSETKEMLQTDADLLNGPSLPDQGLEQDQIDDILAALL